MENEYYSQENHGPYSLFELGDFQLECGRTLANCQLAYSCFGELNSEKTNAIVFTVMFSGTNKAMEKYIGKGLALDPEKYFIVVPNQLGSGLSTSPHNAPPPDAGPDFPQISIGDDVRAQHRLLTEKFGVKKHRTGAWLVHGRAADVRVVRKVSGNGQACCPDRGDCENHPA